MSVKPNIRDQYMPYSETKASACQENVMIRSELHKKLRENSLKIRGKMNLTQDDFADMSGVSVDTIKRIESNNLNYVPSSENLIKIGLATSAIYDGLTSDSDDYQKRVHEEAINLLEMVLIKLKNDF